MTYHLLVYPLLRLQQDSGFQSIAMGLKELQHGCTASMNLYSAAISELEGTPWDHQIIQSETVFQLSYGYACAGAVMGVLEEQSCKAESERVPFQAVKGSRPALLAAHFWEICKTGFWAVLFWILVGKALPKLTLTSPPCDRSTAGSKHKTTIKPQSIKPQLSILKAFHGSNVLITGASGYVGSLVLEQLLRLCPGVQKVKAIQSFSGISMSCMQTTW